jgi:hypothetical protein
VEMEADEPGRNTGVPGEGHRDDLADQRFGVGAGGVAEPHPELRVGGGWKTGLSSMATPASAPERSLVVGREGAFLVMVVVGRDWAVTAPAAHLGPRPVTGGAVGVEGRRWWTLPSVLV